MCRLWSLLQRSVLHCLWSPPDADVMKLQLLYNVGGCDCPQRLPRVKQYARALNNAFLQVNLQ